MPLKYVLKTNDGRTFTGVLGVEIKKTLDKRNRSDPNETPSVVYECLHNGLVVRVWESEIESADAEALT